jgi:hypothetical protein
MPSGVPARRDNLLATLYVYLVDKEEGHKVQIVVGALRP